MYGDYGDHFNLFGAHFAIKLLAILFKWTSRNCMPISFAPPRPDTHRPLLLPLHRALHLPAVRRLALARQRQLVARRPIRQHRRHHADPLLLLRRLLGQPLEGGRIEHGAAGAQHQIGAQVAGALRPRHLRALLRRARLQLARLRADRIEAVQSVLGDADDGAARLEVGGRAGGGDVGGQRLDQVRLDAQLLGEAADEGGDERLERRLREPVGADGQNGFGRAGAERIFEGGGEGGRVGRLQVVGAEVGGRLCVFFFGGDFSD